MTTTNKRILSIIGVVVILATILCCTLVGCSAKTDDAGKQIIANVADDELQNDFTAEIHNTQFVKLAMTEAVAASEGETISKGITATVLPETAVNKAVDWSVEWGDASNTSNVTNYVTVTPDSDGSCNATVTCHQAFTGNILVTVTTRESGYSASCVVSFVGIPTDISVSGSVSPYGANNTLDLGIGSTYVFDVAMSNPFNSVSNSYNNIVCNLAGVGSINVGYMEHYNATGTDVWYDTNNKVLTIDSIKDSFISVSYTNGKLTITTIKAIESYYLTKTRMDGGRTWGYGDHFRSYVDDCYFTVTLTESNSGLSKVITIRFDDAVVTGVSASVTEMVF